MASRYPQFFKGKRITVLGLGLLGKLLGDIQYLSRAGAILTVTDLKAARQLKTSLDALKGYKNITFVLGKHRFQDFENRDFILKGQGTPIDSPYIAHARKREIPIEMDEILFLKFAPPIQLIGVTGTRGKTYTTELIYHILKKAGKRVHLGGNIKGTAALPLLSKVKKGDFVVFELSSWQLQGFGEAKISPPISVFTSFMPDHMNYYRGDIKRYLQDKENIFKYQKRNDTLITLPAVFKLIKSKIKSKVVVVKAETVPSSWALHTPGEHIKANTAAAIAVAKAVKIKAGVIKKAVESFKGVSGRLELVKTLRGIKIYNDTTATTPEATIAGLKALSPLSSGKKVILIAGGTDKNLDASLLVGAINLHVKKVYFLPGSGTKKLVEKKKLKVETTMSKDLKSAVLDAYRNAVKGEIILFSPGFASFELFKNEYDRGEQFVKIIKHLK